MCTSAVLFIAYEDSQVEDVIILYKGVYCNFPSLYNKMIFKWHQTILKIFIFLEAMAKTK